MTGRENLPGPRRLVDVDVWSTLKRCRYCPAQILWAKTRAGKWMPLDPDPVKDGNVILERGVAVVVGGEGQLGLDVGIDRYRTHWETCPGSTRARRR